MAEENSNFKLIVAVAIGAIGGLMLGNYLWGSPDKERNTSKHLATLTGVLKEIENINTEEASNLKERILNIINTFESNYGKSKK